MFTLNTRHLKETRLGCVLLSDLEQLPVASVCRRADHDLDVGGAVVISVMHFLNCGFLIQPPAHTHTRLCTNHLDFINDI